MTQPANHSEVSEEAPYCNASAIEFLARQLDTTEKGASSHWREMHADFTYEDGVLSGLRGFDTYTPAPNPPAAIAHWMLQQPWRRVGRQFTDFERIQRIGRQIAREQQRVFDLDMLRQAITLAYLRQRVPHVFGAGHTILVIGDGFGTFTSTALAAFPGIRVVAINLIRTLLVDLIFMRRSKAVTRAALAIDDRSFRRALADSRAQVVALRADDWRLLARTPITLAVNIASMQEMNADAIAHYFAVMRSGASRPRFYCCNREEKRLPDGTIVRFRDFPWSENDEIIEDALCPWHQQYYSRRPPFFHAIDGPMRHRLVYLAAKSSAEK